MKIQLLDSNFTDELLKSFSKISDKKELLEKVKHTKNILQNKFQLIAGDARDLCPNKKDNEIHTIERIRALVNYLENVVDKALQKNNIQKDSSLNVIVEYQMGQNTQARTIATVLLTHYNKTNVFLVSPAYKNKVKIPSKPELDHSNFIKKYQSLYTANKKHTQALYEYLSVLFNHDPEILKKINTKFKKDFADSVIQILGFLKFGDQINAANIF